MREPACVNPVGRNRGVFGRRQVRGRETELTAATPGTTHDDPLQPVMPSERRRSRRDVTSSNTGTDIGRRKGHRRQGPRRLLGWPRHQLVGLHLEPETFPQVLQHRDRSERAVAEREVLPDHDHRRVQALDQNLVRELVGRHPSELRSERQDEENVHTQLFDETRSLAQARQLRRMTPRTHHFGRVRVEGEHHTRQVTLRRLPDGVRDQLLMPFVDPIEDTNGDHAPSPPAGDLFDSTPSPHAL